MTFEDLKDIGKQYGFTTLGETLAHILNTWDLYNSNPFEFLMELFNIRCTYQFDGEMLGFHITADMTWEDFYKENEKKQVKKQEEIDLAWKLGKQYEL